MRNSDKTDQDKPSIIFIVLDSVRANTFYELLEQGYLPNCERIVDNGTQFTNAISNGPWTVPSHGSMFTGQYPADHGIIGSDPMFEGTDVLPEVLGDAGYSTAAFSANPWLSRDFRFDQYFDSYYDRWGRYPEGADLSSLSIPRRPEDIKTWLKTLKGGDAFLPTLANVGQAFHQRFIASDDGANILTSQFDSWVSNQKQPWFGFFNLTEAHLQYNPPTELVEPLLSENTTVEEARQVPQAQWEYIVEEIEICDAEFERLEALYGGAIRYLDSVVGEILDTINNSVGLGNATVVLVGDHGENIGDHDLMDHQYDISQTLINVPLLLSTPQSQPKQRTELVETRDLYPTLLDNIIDSANERESVSSKNILKEGREFAVSEYFSPRPSIDSLQKLTDRLPKRADRFDIPIRTLLRADGTKLIEWEDGTTQLYNLNTDPDESVDLSERQTELTEVMLSELQERRGNDFQGAGDTFEASGSVGERLESLGYI